MTTDAATPAGFWERVEQVAEKVLARYIRSGSLRNASIGEGGTLTLRGGIFRLIYGAFNLFYVGPISPSLPDGTPQQGFRLRRADGTIALDTRDAFPDPDGTLNQALTWYDRFGNAVFADDTDSGQGIARPYVGGGFGRARFGDFDVFTTSPTFETLWRAETVKQQPNLVVVALASMDTAGTTGEIRVMVNGTPLGSALGPLGFAVTTCMWNQPIAGSHMQAITIEIQGRRTSASGALRVEGLNWRGQQS